MGTSRAVGASVLGRPGADEAWRGRPGRGTPGRGRRAEHGERSTVGRARLEWGVLRWPVARGGSRRGMQGVRVGVRSRCLAMFAPACATHCRLASGSVLTACSPLPRCWSVFDCLLPTTQHPTRCRVSLVFTSGCRGRRHRCPRSWHPGRCRGQPTARWPVLSFGRLRPRAAPPSSIGKVSGQGQGVQQEVAQVRPGRGDARVWRHDGVGSEASWRWGGRPRAG